MNGISVRKKNALQQYQGMIHAISSNGAAYNWLEIAII